MAFTFDTYLACEDNSSPGGGTLFIPYMKMWNNQSLEFDSEGWLMQFEPKLLTALLLFSQPRYPGSLQWTEQHSTHSQFLYIIKDQQLTQSEFSGIVIQHTVSTGQAQLNLNTFFKNIVFYLLTYG